ncbi:glycosyltransferase [Butyrivibrio sp. XPD2006]|uniref:glycosyltransferase n=1 Tax=Butyrivibrio sp. XPD2006 TaxID=1280668 RepID=UPI0018CB0642|nr:glycosyltransferase [Butyrivibrio sp. XPD2006]
MKRSYDYKISVIVPVYKVEDYLNRCLDSIMLQTYKNLEIILVDDGSDDNCPAMCDELAIKDPRIKVIHQENKGLAGARNAGIKAATGDFIAFVDSDDYINHGMFEDMMEQIIAHDADIAMCDIKYVFDGNYPVEANIDKNGPEVEVIDGHQAQFFMCRTLRDRILFTVAWNKLYKRELFDGITYPEGRIHEDEARTHELLYKAERIVYVKSPLYFYFQREDSIVGADVSLKRLNLIDAFDDRLRFYRKKKEYKLWEMEAVHAMRTAVTMQNEFEEKGMKVDFGKQSAIKKLCKEVGKYRSIKGLERKVAMEILFFKASYKSYYAIWKTHRLYGFI